MKSSPHDKPGGRGLLMGAGAALLMVACCSLFPLLVAGGAVAAIGGFHQNPWVIGVGAAVLILAVLARPLRRRSHDSPRCPPTRSDQGTDAKDEQTR